MPAAEASWRAALATRVRQRNQRECESFADLIESHNKLLRANATLTARNEALERELIVSRHADAAPEGGESEAVAALERKVQQLQEELTARYKSDAEGSGAQLELARREREAQTALQAARAELALKTDAHAAAAGEAARLAGELEVRERDVGVLRGEVESLRAQLLKAEAEVKDLTAQNAGLVQRLLDEKNKVASEMNMMNQLMERMRASSAGGAAELALPAGAGGGEGEGEEKADDDSGDVWGGGAGTVVPTAARHVVKAHATEINALAFDESGGNLVTGSADGSSRLFVPQTAAARATLSGGPQAVMSVDMFGAYTLAAANDRIVRVYTTATGRAKTQLAGHKGNIYAARFLRDGRVVSGSADRTIKLWSLKDGRCTRTLAATSAVNGLDVSADALASAHQDGSLRLFDLRTASRVHEVTAAHDGQMTSVAFSPGDGGARLLTLARDNSLRLFDSRTFEPIATLRAEGFRTPFNWSCAGFSPNGRFVCAGGADGGVYIWDTLSNALHATLRGAHSGAVACAKWSPAGNQLASCDKNGFLVVWE